MGPQDDPGHGRPGGIDDPVPDREYGDQGDFTPDVAPMDALDVDEHVDLDCGARLVRTGTGRFKLIHDSSGRAVSLSLGADDIETVARLAGLEVDRG